MQSSYLDSQWRRLQRRIQRDDAPVLIGPFEGEVGFEVLYWIPWLQALRARLGLAPERCIPITRGGAAVWYGCPRAIELYAMRTPQAVRIENRLRGQQTGLMKQMAVSPFDRDVIADVARTLQFRHYHVLHPRWMYRALSPFWEGQHGFAWLAEQTRYALPLPTMALTAALPEKFVAVRFYGRSTLPPCPQTTNFAQATILRLAQQLPVVLLNSRVHTDDHEDFTMQAPNVIYLADLAPMTAENTLAVVSSAIARSLGFVGTYGGLAQLALLLGKPSVSFYLEWGGTAIAHRHLSVELSTRTGVPFQVQRIGDIPLVLSVYPEVASTPTQALSSLGLPVGAPV